MSSIEALRERLYKIIESGNIYEIVKVSQELDKLILTYMKNQLGIKSQFGNAN